MNNLKKMEKFVKKVKRRLKRNVIFNESINGLISLIDEDTGEILASCDNYHDLFIMLEIDYNDRSDLYWYKKKYYYDEKFLKDFINKMENITYFDYDK